MKKFTSKDIFIKEEKTYNLFSQGRPPQDILDLLDLNNKDDEMGRSKKEDKKSSKKSSNKGLLRNFTVTSGINRMNLG